VACLITVSFRNESTCGRQDRGRICRTKRQDRGRTCRTKRWNRGRICRGIWWNSAPTPSLLTSLPGATGFVSGLNQTRRVCFRTQPDKAGIRRTSGADPLSQIAISQHDFCRIRQEPLLGNEGGSHLTNVSLPPSFSRTRATSHNTRRYLAARVRVRRSALSRIRTSQWLEEVLVCASNL